MMAQRKFATCPARLGKRRDMPELWDLQSALQQWGDAPADEPAAAAPAAVPATIDAAPPNFWGGKGSWPRVSKRRTSEDGDHMSLWEVGEALALSAATPACADDYLAELEALVSEEALSTGTEAEELLDVQSFADILGAAVTPAPAPAATPPAAAPAPEAEAMALLDALAMESEHGSPVCEHAPAAAPMLDPHEWLAMLGPPGGEALYEEPAHWGNEGPTSPSPTSVTAEFGSALGGTSPREGAHRAAAPINATALSLHFADGADSPYMPPLEHSRSANSSVSSSVSSSAGSSSRNGAERKEWSAAEDEIIRSSVLAFGCKWRRIAAQLPGRSDDAVRNRWNRLKESMMPQVVDGAAPTMAPAGPPLARRNVSAASEGGSKPERVSWTKAEDATILSSVQELGHKWNKLAERLPGRTDHAIRNRFHRLQTMLEDKQRHQQRMLAPSQPLAAF